MSKPTIKKLFVVFDTNALFTQVASDLINASTKNIIKAHSAHPDLKITWHLPEVVVGERKYQMLEKG